MDVKTKKAVVDAYQTSRNSIQDIARINKVSVDDVLNAIGEGNLATVHVPGDLIDASEAGPDAKMNLGKDVKINFSVH